MNSFPHLTNVDMKASHGNVGYWCWLETKWALPKDVVELTQRTSVELAVVLSYPYPHSELDSRDNRKCKPRYMLFEWEWPWTGYWDKHGKRQCSVGSHVEV